jgi:hypothetical protein
LFFSNLPFLGHRPARQRPTGNGAPVRLIQSG